MPSTSSSTSKLILIARPILKGRCSKSIRTSNQRSHSWKPSSSSRETSRREMNPWNLFSSIGRREFSSSCRCRDHYATLGIPHTATKAQIKSHFYKLSKTHHPDVSKDPKSAEVFAKVSEAYAVLSNDRDRRTYDRSLLHRPTVNHTPFTYAPRAAPTRGARATYAWEYRRRSAGTHPHSQEHTPGAGGHYDPTRPPSYSASQRRHDPFYAARTNRPPMYYHDVLTGSRKREEEAAKLVDQIKRDSSLWRAVQLMGGLAIGVSLLYGFGGGVGGGM